jgi:hypothetical protein
MPNARARGSIDEHPSAGVRHHTATDRDPPFVGAAQTGDHAKRRRFAAAARTENRENLALGDIEIEPADGGLGAE